MFLFRNTILLAIRLLLVVAAFALPVVQPIAARAESVDPADLAALLDDFVPTHLAEHQIPGVTLAVVQDGAILLARGYGVADVEQQRPIDPERTLFRTGSVGKMVTWTAVMQLVEQGRLDLHADVNQYLDFTIPATFAAPITLAHLLTHTPGFEDVPDGLFVLSAAEVPTLEAVMKEQLPARVFAPGEVQAYSNYGTALAGYIVQRVAGQPYEAYVEEHIFTPLGMAHSTFRQPPPATLGDDHAVGYGYHDGRYLPGSFIFVGPTPAGSMSTTAVDMAAFMIAHLEGGRYGDAVLLRPETVAQMQQQLYTPDPRLQGMAHGWMEQVINGRHTVFHPGSILQFNAGLYLLPEANLGLFYAYNGVNGAVAGDAIWRAIIDNYFPAPPPAGLTPPADAAQRMAPYLGEYHPARAQFSGPGKIINLLAAVQIVGGDDGKLTVMGQGVPTHYIEVEPGLFRHETLDSRLAFATLSDGRMFVATDSNPPVVALMANGAVRVPWYESLSVAILLLGGTLLLGLVSAIVWGVGAWRARRRGIRQPSPLRAPRTAAHAFVLLLLVFLLSFVAVMADMDPAYGVPRIFFGDTPLVGVVLAIPWLIAVAGLALIGLSARAWVARTGRLAGKLHLTLFALVALANLVWFWHWDLLRI